MFASGSTSRPWRGHSPFTVPVGPVSQRQARNGAQPNGSGCWPTCETKAGSFAFDRLRLPSLSQKIRSQPAGARPAGAATVTRSTFAGRSERVGRRFAFFGYHPTLLQTGLHFCRRLTFSLWFNRALLLL